MRSIQFLLGLLILQPWLVTTAFVTYEASASFPLCSNFSLESNHQIGFLFGYVENDGAKNRTSPYLPLNATCQCTSPHSLFMNFSAQTLDTYNAVVALFEAGKGSQNSTFKGNATVSNHSSPTNLTHSNASASTTNLTNVNVTNVNVSEANSSVTMDMNASSSSSSNLTSNTSSSTNVSTRSFEGWGRKPGRVLTSTSIPLINVSCLSPSDAEALCKKLSIANEYCPSATDIVIVVQKNIVVINNITKVVVQAATNNDFVTALQKEIAAFLTSFSSSTFFIGSNIGIGKAANIGMDWNEDEEIQASTADSRTMSMLGYLTMAFGHGRSTHFKVMFNATRNESSGQLYFIGSPIRQSDVPPVFYSRYIMWLFTTPSPIFLLCHFANALETFMGSAALDWMMILCGMAAIYVKQRSADFAHADVALVECVGCSNTNVIVWVLFAIASLFFVVLLYRAAIKLIVIGERSTLEIDKKLAYRRLLLFVMITWSAFPILWFFSDKGFGLMPSDWEVLLYVILDVVAKIGFAVLYLYELRSLRWRKRLSYQENISKVNVKTEVPAEDGGASSMSSGRHSALTSTSSKQRKQARRERQARQVNQLENIGND
ncbi:hypothetical protein GUITHDRAFT_99631 [Guillardia theta CCMP2712]|uniref:G-protein coupled receptors family 2 profile 2 domain-containing protein n=1 Tax=Guillardia theta (strain CCMP2712) TaxID=905079 RepID=L1K3E3_GUITC|nr:hypothetical protein GUITHDRAFT_99631 [Guillardia theta CCMP2712]EKX54985.1 hypothetical protein GUITHDRAFT_99631 [Guillardia theta CCMP2712]|eukprot:XP_005841965.1 hypothetical protein GUITHDRAFT_99631 [Guillardia theta CCMP2712]